MKRSAVSRAILWELKTNRYQSIAVIALIAMVVLLSFGCAGRDRDSFGIDLPLAQSQVISLTLESECMEREMPFMVYFPQGYGGGDAYPVWYALHGYGSTESMWLDAGIGKAADELIEGGEIDPMIMVFPLTRYDSLEIIQADLADGKREESRMDRFLCEELIPYIDARCDTIASSECRYIGGFSMGGMIALRTAFHHPDLFGKAGGYSPAMPSSEYSGTQFEEWLYPNDTFEEVDVAALARENSLTSLKVWLDCGTANDPFSEPIQSLRDALRKRGIPAEFRLYDGGHDIHNVMDNIEECLTFYSGGEIE